MHVRLKSLCNNVHLPTHVYIRNAHVYILNTNTCVSECVCVYVCVWCVWGGRGQAGSTILHKSTIVQDCARLKHACVGKSESRVLSFERACVLRMYGVLRMYTCVFLTCGREQVRR